MAQLPGSAFLRGRSRFVKISSANPRVTKASGATSSGPLDEQYTPETGNTVFGLKGLITADYSPVINNQEFFLLGDEGFRDSVATSQAADLACTAYFTLATSSGSLNTTDVKPDPALELILETQSQIEKEIFVEVFTLLGEQSTDGFTYYVRAFNAGVVDFSESNPGDGLVELSWTFQSRGQVFYGQAFSSTAIDIYA
jgi:hypothetical protein